ncbi:Fungal specific transcription factor domain containing protein [Hyaloscypha variabilis]
MEPLDAGSETQASTLAKPCIACRKRKVKCSKTRPCANCARSKQLCLYDGDEPDPDIARQSIEGSVSGDGEVRERLARLEKLMEMMMVRESGRPSAGSDAGFGAAVARDALSHISHRASTSPSQARSPHSNVTRPSETPGAPVGQILFQEVHSAYFDAGFWAGLATEIEDPRRLFDPPSDRISQSWVSSSMLGLPSLSPSESSYTPPTLDESNFLCKLFFENVNPFIRVLHQAHFGRELDRHRRGRLEWPAEFEALLSTIYLLAINSLRPEIVQRAFLTPKAVLISRYQHVCQCALAKVEFFKTNRIHALQALLYYLTFLFQQNLYQDAIALLGVAARVAQTMGHHRDPSHFPFSPWVCEIRRRIWNHLYCLDAMALSFYGAEPCLPPTSDAQPPQNANEIEWHTSRFANPSSVPSSSGFTDMTFILAHRLIAESTQSLADVDPLDFEKREFIIGQAETNLRRNYDYDTADPSHKVVAAYTEVRIASLRLSNQHRQTQKATTQPMDSGRHQVFIAAIELLEAFEYHSKTFTSNNWEWIFDTIVPWLAIAIVLTQLPHATQQQDIDRANWQININFERFSSHENPLSGTPMWRLLLQLRENMQGVPVNQDSVVPNVSQELSVATVPFTPDLVLDSDLYASGNEAFLYEDQFMQDLPWYGSRLTSILLAS